jgi:RNA polymerase sigma-70 factor, ECF subfamily
MEERDRLTEQFEANRTHLRAVAYRMLGSLDEADDAVQEVWLRLFRSDASTVQNVRGWLTTVVGRVCLDMLRSRRSRREAPLGAYVPDPFVSREDRTDPEHEALLADSVGLALFAVLETLSPAERLAFLAAAREGDFDALVAVLDPDVVLRADLGPLSEDSSTEVRGAAEVAGQALTYSRLDLLVQPALVNGAVGAVSTRDGNRSRSGASRSGAGRSSRSAYSPTPRACAASTWRRSSTTDARRPTQTPNSQFATPTSYPHSAQPRQQNRRW